MTTDCIALQPKRHETVLFFLLAFGITWAFWIPAALASHGRTGDPFPPGLSTLLGAFGPTLAALILTAAFRGGSGLKHLLGRFLIVRVGIRWYAFALLFTPALTLACIAIGSLFGRPLPDFAHPPILDLESLPQEARSAGAMALLPIMLVQQLLISSPMGEEIGWRGYALPRLQYGRSALAAAVVIGLLWGLWHVPLLYTQGHPLAGSSVGWMVIGPVADAILFAWLFNNTRGSLLLVLLCHASLNMTGLFLPRADLPYLSLALKWVLVLTLVAVSGPERLSRRPCTAPFSRTPEPAA